MRIQKEEKERKKTIQIGMMLYKALSQKVYLNLIFNKQ